jgi:hypothetical protein
MKKALVAKRRYLVASAKADAEMTGVAGLEEAGADDAWGDDDDEVAPAAPAPEPAPAPAPAPAADLPPPAAADPPPPEGEEGDDDKW